MRDLYPIGKTVRFSFDGKELQGRITDIRIGYRVEVEASGKPMLWPLPLSHTELTPVSDLELLSEVGERR